MAEVAPDGPALVFLGFMGAGKSTAARDVAAVLGVRHHDTDRLLEQRFGHSIEKAFARLGESGFREQEEALAVELLEHAGPGDVIALGGGSVLSARTRAALERHIAVLLEVDLDIAWKRASGRGRPRARDRDAFVGRYAEREALYRSVADAVLPAVDRHVARRALAHVRRLTPGTRLLWAHATSGEYPVVVGRDALDPDPWPATGRRFVITDETVAAIHGGRLGEVAATVTIPPGERHKTLATVERVQRELIRAGATRGDHIVALGGGVVGDVAGFCAATYQRGIPVVQVPTTLVAQVDSAYGGKTGVDLPEGKNYVGAFHQPAGVLVDTALLRTLPPAELAAGRAEVIKTALIAGGALWQWVREGRFEDEQVVLECARAKLAIVAADERDGGRRQVLNLGHTVGHAIETATGYSRLRHGEAVGLGLLAALRLSHQPTLRDEVAALLVRAGLPTTIDGLDVDAVLAATERDKKRKSGEPVPFVLVAAPGDVRHGRPVPHDELRAAVAELAR
jgi:shikimate kinase/3-dehydroquinate synthase